ncbi:MAG TPA: aspartate/glutamate racemase family protein [Caulobacteraceae bacterium]|nr:aspartate/glutamate racemase family protein [Caulobacteraceae bacterium]
MKTLGLLGGMSWESSAVYYRRLNEGVRERLGGQHSAKLVMWSADFAPIAEMQASGRWGEATALLCDAARGLQRAGADAILICANTMHRMAAEVAAAVAVPLIHVADVTADAIRAAGVERPLLLATGFVMEQPFYRERLRARGVDTLVPPQAERRRLHAIIFDELVQGRFAAASRAEVIGMIDRAVAEHAADAVIFGCTEIGMLVPAEDPSVPVFDTLELHVAAGLAFALGQPSGRAPPVK